MNRRWLIKINGEDDLYYDSENKEYRLRLFCPNCHKPSTCQCYKSYEDYISDSISELPVMCCSYFCCLNINSDNETENIIKAAQDIGLEIKHLTKYTEKEAEQIVDHLLEEGIWDLSDESTGEQCKN